MLNIFVEGVKLTQVRLGSHIYIYRMENKMTTIVANTFEIVGLHGIANFFKRLGAEIKRRRNIRHTINELSRLTNHDLNDIGISRGEIRHLADEHYKDVVNANLKGWV